MAITPQAIDPYIRSIVMARMHEIGLPIADSFMRRRDIETALTSLIREWASVYSADVSVGREYLASELFDMMLSANVIVEDGDDIAGSYYKIRPSQVRAFAQVNLSNDAIYSRKQRIGEQYLIDAFSAYDREHEHVGDQSDIKVPASDRIVLLNDNHPEIVEIRETAHGLAAALHQANDVGDFSPEELNVASMEMDQLVVALDNGSIRESYIAQIAPKVLRWISEKAAGAAVGKAALALLALVASFFGFDF